jgi:hypothetical protein
METEKTIIRDADSRDNLNFFKSEYANLEQDCRNLIGIIQGYSSDNYFNLQNFSDTNARLTIAFNINTIKFYCEKFESLIINMRALKIRMNHIQQLIDDHLI